MRLHLYLDVQVSCRPAVDARLAFAGKPDAIAVVHPRGNLDRQRLLFFHSCRAVAGRAGLRDDLPCPMAFRAGLLDGEEPLLHAHLTLAFTGRAGPRLCAGLCARTLTALAVLVGRNPYPRLRAASGLLEGDFEVV